VQAAASLSGRARACTIKFSGQKCENCSHYAIGGTIGVPRHLARVGDMAQLCRWRIRRTQRFHGSENSSAHEALDLNGAQFGAQWVCLGDGRPRLPGLSGLEPDRPDKCDLRGVRGSERRKRLSGARKFNWDIYRPSTKTAQLDMMFCPTSKQSTCVEAGQVKTSIPAQVLLLAREVRTNHAGRQF